MAAKLLDFGFQNIDLWRSEEMQLVQLIIPAESAHQTISALGDVGLLQFKDLNVDKSAFQRTYASQVKRCDEMARRLRFFHEQVEKAGMVSTVRPPQDKTYDLDELESKLEELERDLLEMNGNTERLQRSYNELTELQLVLEKAGNFFADGAAGVGRGGSVPTANAFDGAFTETPDVPLLGEAGQQEKGARIGFVAGTIFSDKIAAFERLLFRATRGNMYLKQAAIGKVRDPSSGDMVDKHVYVIFFAGDRSKAKVNKICDAFSAARYPFPEETVRQRQMHADVVARIRELSTTIEAGERHRDAVLTAIALNLQEWSNTVRREKAVYHTLNKLSVDYTSKVLVAEAWVPSYAKARVQEILRTTAQRSSTQLSTILQPLATHDPPPTYYRTNKFTECFQTIVEAYGVAKYREVNPAVLTIMTFPFLFAVMFGDLGHALLMLAVAVWMVRSESKLLKMDLGDMFGMLFGGRYCILLMALFSIWMGLIYNEFFSMPMEIFGRSHFKCMCGPNHQYVNTTVTDLRNCNYVEGCEVGWPSGATPYVMGVDPVWHGRKTELPFLNSMKMKMSILLGVVHMDFGILMSLFNNIFYRDTLSTLCEFVPQMLFLNSIFGYLCCLILGKWVSGSLIDLYHVLIYMFLSPGTIDYTPLFSGQGGLQVFLLLLALVCVPWMLFVKPLVLKKRHEAMQKAKGAQLELAAGAAYGSLGHDDDEEARRPHRPAAAAHGGGHGDSHGGGHGGHGDHFEYGEVAMHQMIHTIEFVLGAVSNTASYLRLWALSLAHSQLSAVFYDRVLMASINMGNIGAMIIGFFVFACATLGVLMVMESLSAFLHALRLHWVEYMSKFYKGDGYNFQPFSFELIAKEEAEANKK